MQKLQEFPQQNKLTQALQEYGRLLRTFHILRWYADEAERRRINLPLNKGEALHSLRAVITVANKGVLRRKQEGGVGSLHTEKTSLSEQVGQLNEALTHTQQQRAEKAPVFSGPFLEII
ncbi:Tn3 family transposase [Nitrosococcus watsonii]|uniref:Tn3 family transposase n=1 Tax=Nitrosococcus watsonii TaxID=473531 RepID=UPI000316579B